MKKQNNLLQNLVDVGRSLAQSSGAVGQGNNQTRLAYKIYDKQSVKPVSVIYSSFFYS